MIPEIDRALQKTLKFRPTCTIQEICIHVDSVKSALNATLTGTKWINKKDIKGGKATVQ